MEEKKPKRRVRRFAYSKKLRDMHRKKPRPEQQLHLDIVLGAAKKAARLSHVALTAPAATRKGAWHAYLDAEDEFRYRKNHYMALYVPDHTPELVKYPGRYVHPDEKPEVLQVGNSPNESDYAEE